MLKSIVFSMLLIAPVLSISLQSNEICRLASKNCFRPHDKHQVKCASALPYTCDCNLCTTNSEVCEVYQNAESFLKSTISSYYKQYKNRTRENLFKFYKSISSCTSLEKVTKSDICINDKNCYSKQESVMGPARILNKRYKVKKTTCPCRKPKPYECGIDFCTTSIAACDAFILAKKKNLIVSHHLKSCGNSSFREQKEAFSQSTNSILRMRFLI